MPGRLDAWRLHGSSAWRHWALGTTPLTKQQHQWRQGTLGDDRRRRLEGLGVQFSGREAAWEARFQQLLQFKQEFGHADVPAHWPPNQGLANWAMTQRQRWLGGLGTPPTPLQQSRLLGCGFRVQPLHDKWAQRYVQLCQLRQQRGGDLLSAPLPAQGGLAAWLSFQQWQWRAGRLSPERVARLEGLGVSRPAPTRRLRWQQQVEAVDALVGAVGFPAAHALLVLAPANAAADMAAHAMHSSSGSSGGTSSGSRGLADGSSAAAPEGPQQRAAGGSMTAEEAAAVVRSTLQTPGECTGTTLLGVSRPGPLLLRARGAPAAIMALFDAAFNETVMALAQENMDASIPPTLVSDINNIFTLQSGYMVFFMQAGFAMLCAGSVRAKNAKNIILLNILDACFGCCAWYLTGWAFAYGDPVANADCDAANFTTIKELSVCKYGDFGGSQAFIGNRNFAMSNLDRGTYWLWFFQFTFAATGATIISGAVAERCKFEAYMLYELAIVLFVYPCVAHWVWSPFGWLSPWRNATTAVNQSYVLFAGSGVYDFAGDAAVHMVGGIASLGAAWVLGPRIGRFDAAGQPVDMPGHNASLTLLGVFLLWFGWYGFNPGSNLMITAPGTELVSKVVAAVAVNTTVGAASGCIATLFIAMAYQYFTLGVVVWDLIIAGNGALAGLVAITGPCAFVQTWAAFIIGAIGGFVYFVASKVNLSLLKIDDPLDAIAVHAGCGIWGLIAAGAFAAPGMVSDVYGAMPCGDLAGEGCDPQRPYGFIMGGNASVLAANCTCILVVGAWTLALMTPFFMLLKKVGLFRVSPEVEAQGLDVSHHGGSAYPHETKGANGGAKGELGFGITPEMVDRKIEEALEKMRKQMGTAAV
ncbi:ammonium transporter [Micractinium conductrix]|uniref:Ammonium transporter n=1 Tax=Micractinium conductrix TaxID=554055 RepID=A0A2P6V2N0_9CHLO|nr:ammonium transporter [Micractinium conductrix]|eukprot:PSC68349.1 ammonium transporter [Micractinium conductrix]